MMTLVAALLSVGAPSNPEAVDVSGYRDNLRVYSDGHNHNVALWAGGPGIVAFYGDGHTFYDIGFYASSQAGDGFELMVNDPRYKFTAVEARMESKDGSTIDVYCSKRHTVITKMEKSAYKAMIAKAEFKRSPWRWVSYALARDDKGTYYYVDRGRYDDNDQVFHVYVGPRGNMKELKLKNIVHDSAGDIFATADGDLRLIIGEKPATEWVNKDVHTQLTSLPPTDNGAMIWNDLGVHRGERFGTPCDDL